MKRRISVVVWASLGVFALIPIGGLCLLAGFAWIISGPRPRTVLARAQPVANRIVDALGEYHRRHGSYPPELSDLVNAGLLPRVPELPSHWGASSKHGPDYEAHALLDFYQLSFGYCIQGGIGPGDDHFRVFVSDDPHGWKTTDSPESMENLVADRVLAIYRKRHDAKSLDLFMSDVIGKADCDHLYRSRVIEWLGEGAEIDLPSDMAPAGVKGYIYQAQDDPTKRYCCVYKDHWLPTFATNLPDAAALVDQNYPVLDKLLVLEEREGRETWTVLRDCPKSPRDQPSGRRTAVDSNPDRQ